MALPKIDVPIYETSLISDETKNVKFRSFKQKDKKLILSAYSGGDQDEINLALKQAINNCIISEDIDVEKLPWYDVQKIFLELRKRSVGTDFEVSVDPRKDAKKDCPCSKPIKMKVSLEDVEVIVDKERSNKIEFSETSGMILRDPTLDDYLKLDSVKPHEKVYQMVQSCIEAFYDKDTITSAKDEDPKELQALIDEMPDEYFSLVEKFFDSAPKIQIKIEHTCPKCKTHREFTIERLDDFLG